jgi:hypothetical protein
MSVILFCSSFVEKKEDNFQCILSEAGKKQFLWENFPKIPQIFIKEQQDQRFSVQCK